MVPVMTLHEFAKPGDIYRTDVQYQLADGTTTDDTRHVIIWSVSPGDPDAQHVETVLMQWAGTEVHGDFADKPNGRAMLVELGEAGMWAWGAISGKIHSRVGKYTALDENANSVEIMAAGAAKAVQNALPYRELWTAAECAEHINVTPSTWRAYVAQGRTPAKMPTLVPGINMWRAEEVREWHRKRPKASKR